MNERDSPLGGAGVLRLLLLVICTAGVGWAAGYAIWTIFR
jgi:hypothetical protein